MSNEEQNPTSCQTAVSGSAFSIHDLKCGNILNYYTAEGEILPIVINWQDLKWLTEDTKGFNLVHSPIELNSSILHRLGFDQFTDDNEWYRLENSEYTIDVYYTHSGGNWYVHFNNERLPFRTVHELQNFYYCLAGVMLSLS